MLHYPRLLTSSGEVDFPVDSADLMLDERVGSNRLGLSLFVASYLSLLSDSPITPNLKPLSVYTKFYQELCRDLKGLVVRLTDLSHEFVSLHTLMGPGSSIGPWISDFKETPVFFEYNRYYHTGDPSLLSYLYMFLSFGKKLEYDDEEFHTTAFRGWMENEKDISSLKFDNDDPIVNSMKFIIANMLPPPGNEFWPKHGPGRVAERIERGYDPKHRALRYDRILDYIFFRGHIGMYGMGEEFGLSPHKVIPNDLNWTEKDGRSRRRRLPAKLMFVPKNLKTSRSICMEPAVMMFFQQAVARRLVDAIDGGPFSQFIKLSDQGYNRWLSYVGSFTGEIDTLDLSSASDRLSFELVKRVFPTSWLIQMIATRSGSVLLPTGDEYVIHKFAPMGSALCFPTQCIIFASAAILAAHIYRVQASPAHPPGLESTSGLYETLGLFSRPKAYLEQADVSILPGSKGIPGTFGVARQFADPAPSRRYLHRRLQPLGIFGDDIACDGKLADGIKSILRHLGFQINDQKSFTGSQAFKESCGGYYLGGIDITPRFYRIRGVRRFASPSHIISQVHLINACRARGYERLYSFLLHSLREWPSRYGTYSVPFVHDLSDEFGVKSGSQRNDHLVVRRNEELQRDEYRVWSISVKDTEDRTWYGERYSYMRWWASRRYPSTVDLPWSTGHRSTVGYRVKWRWTPLY